MKTGNKLAKKSLNNPELELERQEGELCVFIMKCTEGWGGSPVVSELAAQTGGSKFRSPSPHWCCVGTKASPELQLQKAEA